MKRFFTFMGLVSAAIVSTNCTREIDVTSPEGGVNFSLTAIAEDTKTVNDGISTNWAANDDLILFHAEAGTTAYVNDKKFVVSEEDLSTGKFKGTLGSALESGKSYDWYALYPYESHIISPENEKGYLYIGSSSSSKAQKQTGNNSTAHLAGSYFPLCGKASSVSAETPVSLTLKPALSVVKVHVTNISGESLTVNSVSLTAEEDIIGSYFINFAGETPSFIASDSKYVSNKASLEVTDAEEIADKASADFYFAIKPFTATNGSDLKLSVNGYEKTVTLTADKVFPCGKIKTLNFNYDFVTPEYSGTYVILAKNVDNYFAMSGVPGTNTFMPKKDYSGTVNPAITVNIDDTDIFWNITKAADGYTLKNATNDKFLYYTSTAGKNSASLDTDPHYHTILPSTDGTVNIKEISSDRLLRYNPGSPRFAYYETETGIADLILQPATYVVSPKITVTSTTPVSVEASGATGLEVSYSITNPASGKSISASCEENWIKNLSCATAGKVTFDVDANTGSKRTATVTLKYEGATDVTFTVEQETTGSNTYIWTLATGQLKTDGGTYTSGSVTWTYPSLTYVGFDASKGAQIGSSKKPQESCNINTTFFNGKTIKSITVNASMGSSGDAKLSIAVGGTDVLSNQELSTSAKDYSVSGINKTGNVEIIFSATAKAYYLKSVTIEY